MFANARRVTAAIVLCFFNFSLFAQQAPQLGETLDISIVNVDVFVTDRDGNRVHGLTQKDFEIYENGKLQPISNFAEYAGDAERGTVSVDAGAQPEPEAAPAPREKRTVLLFFEQTRLPAFAVEKLVKSVKQMVHGIIGPDDAVSIVLWSPGGIVHTEFTNDLSLFDRALDRVARYAVKAEIDVAAQQQEDLADALMFEEGIAALSSTVEGTSPLPPAGPETNTAVNLYMMQAYNEMQVRVAAINSAIDSMSGIDGKKILLLATRRLGEVAGAEYAFAAGAKYLPIQLRQTYGAEHLTDSIIANANASGITIYPVNLPGLGPVSNDASRNLTPEFGNDHGAAYLTLINENVSLQNIAQKTGGAMAAGAVDIVSLLPRIADDVTDYYSLAYRVPSTGGDFTRNVEVKTRNRNYVVRARRQFVEKSDDTRMRDRLRATLFRAKQDSQVHIAATAGEPKKTRGVSTLPVTVRIPIGDLTLLPQGGAKHAGKFSVYVAAASDLSRLSDVTQKSQPFEIADAQLDAAKASHFTYDLEVRVNAETKYLAVGVLDEVGRSYGLLRLDLQEKPTAQ
jgi:VWFA-related protein